MTAQQSFLRALELTRGDLKRIEQLVCWYRCQLSEWRDDEAFIEQFSSTFTRGLLGLLDEQLPSVPTNPEFTGEQISFLQQLATSDLATAAQIEADYAAQLETWLQDADFEGFYFAARHTALYLREGKCC